MGVSGVNLPLSSAAARVSVFITEPGSTTSVTARLRCASGPDPSREFGLYEGWLTMARISPVGTSSTTIEPLLAPCSISAVLSSR